MPHPSNLKKGNNMYTTNQAGGVVSTAEELQTHIAIREAKKKGHKFIEVYYNQDLIQDAVAQFEVRINGLQSIRVYPGRDSKNRLKYDVVVSGGQLVFQYNESIDQWVGEVLDDKTPGLYGEEGYNRDFLATHYETGEFIIKDGRVKRDIERRLERIKKMNAEKKEKSVEEDVTVLPALIEEQKRLEEKIAAAKKKQEESKTKSFTGPVVNIKGGPPEKKEPDAQHQTSS